MAVLFKKFTHWNKLYSLHFLTFLLNSFMLRSYDNFICVANLQIQKSDNINLFSFIINTEKTKIISNKKNNENNKAKNLSCSLKRNDAFLSCSAITSFSLHRDPYAFNTLTSKKMLTEHNLEESLNTKLLYPFSTLVFSLFQRIKNYNKKDKRNLQRIYEKDKEKQNEKIKSKDNLLETAVYHFVTKSIEDPIYRKLITVENTSAKNKEILLSVDNFSSPFLLNNPEEQLEVADIFSAIQESNMKAEKKKFINGFSNEKFSNKKVSQDIKVHVEEKGEVDSTTSSGFTKMLGDILKENLEEKNNDLYLKYRKGILSKISTDINRNKTMKKNLDNIENTEAGELDISEEDKLQNESIEKQKQQKYGLLAEQDYMDNFAIGDIPKKYWDKACKSYDCFNGIWQINISRSDTLEFILKALGFNTLKRRVMETHRSISEISLNVVENYDTPFLSVATYLPMQIVKKVTVPMNCSYIDTPDKDTGTWKTRGCMVDGRALQRRDGDRGIMFDTRVVFERDPAHLMPGKVMLFKWTYIPYATGIPYTSNRWLAEIKKYH